ncbi:hypothetical protein RchiOBHm_Chr2g0142881 [Rosa chinensis]|uniref:Uncharacterized protein n=1 Tax=Rosa chinensis TaxID=74649 RepID=A0A2P6RY01_ROSCH|nr:hypothetical protein RchiOBHm_Chr2g0142881 [Rosa chinensis]
MLIDSPHCRQIQKQDLASYRPVASLSTHLIQNRNPLYLNIPKAKGNSSLCSLDLTLPNSLTHTLFLSLSLSLSLSLRPPKPDPTTMTASLQPHLSVLHQIPNLDLSPLSLYLLHLFPKSIILKP